MAHVIIGTAGHIDHGKTSLVKALTGVDTDRLKEEKERGLTIDLGFAHWGERATIIDVPGHEKFIRNMVAGVSTIHFVLFVVAADDGVMPQTREHLDILRILQIPEGIVVITKMDLVEPEWGELVKDDVRNLVKGTFLETAPVVSVSSTTQDGITELKTILEARWHDILENQDQGNFWMPVDRSFTMKGFGTVVTGSVLSGSVTVGQSIEILPQRDLVKIRGIQSHGKTVDRVGRGDRAAINLQAVGKNDVQRGNVLTNADYFRPSLRLDARFQLLESAPRPVKSGTRLRLHIGTDEVMVRVSPLGVTKVLPGETAYVQFHLEKPACARRLDPFLIRQYSPTITLGGGIILDATPKRHRTSDRGIIDHLKSLEMENPLEVLERKLLTADFTLPTLDQLAAEISVSKIKISKSAEQLQRAGKVRLLNKQGHTTAVHEDNYAALRDKILRTLRSFHESNPTRIGLSKKELHKEIQLKVDPTLLEVALDELKAGEITETEGQIQLVNQKARLSTAHEQLKNKIAELLYEQGFATASEQELAQRFGVDCKTVTELVNLMIGLRELTCFEGRILLHPKRVEQAHKKVISFLRDNVQITVGQFKDLLGTSRKYALPLLIHLDGRNITRREGDVRILGDAA